MSDDWFIARWHAPDARRRRRRGDAATHRDGRARERTNGERRDANARAKRENDGATRGRRDGEEERRRGREAGAMRARATRDEAGDDRGDGGDERVRRRCERTDAHFDAGGELQAQYVDTTTEQVNGGNAHYVLTPRSTTGTASRTSSPSFARSRAALMIGTKWIRITTRCRRLGSRTPSPTM